MACLFLISFCELDYTLSEYACQYPPAERLLHAAYPSYFASLPFSSELFCLVYIVVQNLTEVNKKFRTYLLKVHHYFCAFFDELHIEKVMNLCYNRKR